MATEQCQAAVASEHRDGGQPMARGAEVVTRDRTTEREPRRLIPVALSALLEGFGQAYNRQQR